MTAPTPQNAFVTLLTRPSFIFTPAGVTRFRAIATRVSFAPPGRRLGAAVVQWTQ